MQTYIYSTICLFKCTATGRPARMLTAQTYYWPHKPNPRASSKCRSLHCRWRSLPVRQWSLKSRKEHVRRLHISFGQHPLTPAFVESIICTPTHPCSGSVSGTLASMGFHAVGWVHLKIINKKSVCVHGRKSRFYFGSVLIWFTFIELW